MSNNKDLVKFIIDNKEISTKTEIYAKLILLAQDDFPEFYCEHKSEFDWVTRNTMPREEAIELIDKAYKFIHYDIGIQASDLLSLSNYLKSNSARGYTLVLDITCDVKGTGLVLGGHLDDYYQHSVIDYEKLPDTDEEMTNANEASITIKSGIMEIAIKNLSNLFSNELERLEKKGSATKWRENDIDMDEVLYYDAMNKGKTYTTPYWEDKSKMRDPNDKFRLDYEGMKKKLKNEANRVAIRYLTHDFNTESTLPYTILIWLEQAVRFDINVEILIFETFQTLKYEV